MNLAHGEPQRPLRILLLEDSSLDAELAVEQLRAAGLDFEVDRVIERPDFSRAIDCAGYDLILADYSLPAFDGMSALDLAQQHCPDTPFVFVSGNLGEEIAVEALKRGATDYVLKHNLQRLPGTVMRALAEAQARRERKQAERALHEALEQKTALLRELDHRVNNNLQLLVSLFHLERKASRDPETIAALERMQGRVRALAHVHHQLYGEKAGQFDLSSYASSLIDELASTHAPALEVACELQPILVAPKESGAAALILHEVMLRALALLPRHARGRLRLTSRADSAGRELVLTAESVGLEEAFPDPGKPLLAGLARQLDITVEHAPPQLFRLRLPPSL